MSLSPALHFCRLTGGWILGAALLGVTSCPATILWREPASRLIHASPEGTDILGGKVKRDDTASDVLFFKFHVDPLSDAANEPYYALFQLNEGDTHRLAVGNALEAWGYSAAYASETGPSNKLNEVDSGEFNLRSSHPEGSVLGGFMPYELPSHNRERTLVFKVQYVPGGDDLITVWLDPELTHGATVENQPESLITTFKANASFDQIRLRHDGGGNGWIFSDMAIATSFDDYVVVRFWQTWWFRGLSAVFVLAGVGAAVRVVEKRKYQNQLRRAEQERALEQERSRIAQDLHDELGSLVTRISLLGGLLRSDKDNPEQVEIHAQKISQTADQTVRALEEIVWAVRPGSDTLQSLMDYIAHFASELFEDNPARCRLDLPHDLPARPLPPDVRHNIFLVIKEALTNALKHAAAKEVRVQAKAANGVLEITIQDDGCGFDPVAPPRTDGQRHGTGNMLRRAQTIGAALTLHSEPGRGTSLCLTLPLPEKTAGGEA